MRSVKTYPISWRTNWGNSAIGGIDASGWSSGYTNPPTFTPDSSPESFSVSRLGYDGNGNATTLTESIVYTQRVRRPYPNQASLTAGTVALSDYVYSTDSITGIANNSTEISPNPVCAWIMPSRLTVTNTINLELVAFHRNAAGGKQVACVIFSATDGTTTVTQTVSSPTISSRGGDALSIPAYICALNVTTLSDTSLITCNAKVYPRVGSSASIADSATTTVVSGSTLRAFTPRYFYKDTAGQASPWYAYVASTGSDTTGIASQTAASAALLPCLTVKAAINKAHTAASKVDNVIIRVVDTVSLGNTFFGNWTQKCGSVTVTRDPTVTRAAAVAKLDVAFNPPIVTGFLGAVNVGAVYFTDLTILRSGVIQFGGTINYYFDNVTFDNASGNAAWLGGGTTNDYHFATTFQNVSTAAGLASATGEHRCFRGCTGTLGGNGVESWLNVGNVWIGAVQDQFGSSSTPPTRTAAGSVIYQNMYSTCTAGTPIVQFGANENITGLAIVQNLFEWCSATTQFATRISGDSPAIGSMTHVIMHHNTYTGFWNCGRDNLFYDSTVGSLRTPKLLSLVGNVHTALNCKNDLFMTDGQYVGDWPFYYGVGCRGQFSQYADANSGGGGGSFMQTYPGLKANIGTSTSVRNDPLFTAYQGTTSGPTAGAGGGTYTVGGGSPCLSMVASAVLSFDLGGNARSATNDTAGAFA